MCEFNKKIPKPQLDAQQQSPKEDDDYARALNEIEQLKGELQKKDMVLDLHQKEQVILRERLQACIKTIRETTSQLNSVEIDLKKQYKQVIQHVEQLQQENRDLKLSNDAWSNRSIKLEFDVLTAHEEIKAIKADHELSVSKIAVLEMELKAVKTENEKLRRNRWQEGNE